MSEAGVPLSATDVKSIARDLGADDVGIAPAEEVTARDRFLTWLAAGHAGEMTYLGRWKELRFDPDRLLSGARSVVVVAVNYSPVPEDGAQWDGPFRVAKYAWGEDYHRLLRRILKRLRRRLRDVRPGLKGRICVDTAPFPDKYWAARAGIGWQGKHTNLVSRQYGSWLLLGSLVIDAQVDQYDSPHDDFCGSCRACLDACPTGAFPEAYVLDARRCISYWTIESKAPDIPESVSTRQYPWVFGCDICLDVCPWNRFEKPHRHDSLRKSAATRQLEGGRVDTLSDAAWRDEFNASPLTRPGRAGLCRNVRAARRSRPDDARSDA